MPRRNPPAKWVLPAVVNPSGRRTIVLCIPDDEQHIAAFRGALQALGSAYNWADDDAHTAKDVAQVWRDVIDIGDSCMEFRQDACHLYLVSNGIETLIYNGQECINANIADGTLAKANSGYIGTIPPMDCKTYTVKLDTGNNWVCPTPVNSGDTIHLQNWQGGATDLGLLSAVWICPAGTAYEFGACADTLRSYTIYGTDPLQTAPHLAVIGQIGDTYYDVWNAPTGGASGTFTVPPGVQNQPLRLLMNIGQLVGLVASGEMWGEVVVCNNNIPDVVVEQACDPNGCNGTGPFGTLNRNTQYTFNSTHSTYYCAQERMDLYFHNAVDISIGWPQNHQPGCANWAWYRATNASSNQTNTWTGIAYGSDLPTVFQGIEGIVFAGPDGSPFSVTLTVTKVYP